MASRATTQATTPVEQTIISAGTPGEESQNVGSTASNLKLRVTALGLPIPEVLGESFGALRIAEPLRRDLDLQQFWRP
jgi:hypothetical protein